MEASLEKAERYDLVRFDFFGYHHVGKLISLLYPRRCPVCDGIVPFGKEICPGCEGTFRPVTQPWCMKCGKKLMAEEEYCADCARQKHHFCRARSLYEYESVAGAIYRLKYAGRQEYADYFGRKISIQLAEFLKMTAPDALIPVPLHPKRKRKRGYNQAALLARAVSAYTGIPVYENYVKRVRNTQPLKRQNPRERQNNLKKAFNITQNDVKLKSTIIIDDIYTTGSTVDEIAHELKAHGVQRIYVITLACGAGV